MEDTAHHINGEGFVDGDVALDERWKWEGIIHPGNVYWDMYYKRHPKQCGDKSRGELRLWWFLLGIFMEAWGWVIRRRSLVAIWGSWNGNPYSPDRLVFKTSL